jgi:hypothetical protein
MSYVDEGTLLTLCKTFCVTALFLYIYVISAWYFPPHSYYVVLFLYLVFQVHNCYSDPFLFFFSVDLA